jgi:hypothetical protein
VTSDANGSLATSPTLTNDLSSLVGVNSAINRLNNRVQNLAPVLPLPRRWRHQIRSWPKSYPAFELICV